MVHRAPNGLCVRKWDLDQEERKSGSKIRKTNQHRGKNLTPPFLSLILFLSLHSLCLCICAHTHGCVTSVNETICRHSLATNWDLTSLATGEEEESDLQTTTNLGVMEGLTCGWKSDYSTEWWTDEWVHPKEALTGLIKTNLFLPFGDGSCDPPY